MKRFAAAIIILIFIFSLSVMLNLKVVRITENLLTLANENADSAEISNYWQQNERFIMMILPHAQTDQVVQIIYELPQNNDPTDEYNEIKRTELKKRLEALKNSFYLKPENIF